MKINPLNYLPILSLTAVMLLTMTGCANEGLGSDDYSRNQARSEHHVRVGTVESIRKVKIEGTRTGVGVVAGAGLGGLLGSEIGEGKGNIAATIGGAVLGGIAGQATEQALTKQDGLEITVVLESGKTISVVQAQTEDERFRVGDRVKILSGHGTTRVTH
ncbi:Outer membrane lipoprotein pcp [Gammaproteobacteria bacterium]